MDRFKFLDEEDDINTRNNDDTTHGRRRNRTKRIYHCRIPLPAGSSSSSPTSTEQEGFQSDVGSSSSGQPLPITIEIKLCASRSNSNAAPMKSKENKSSRRMMAPLNEVEQQEFEAWQQNRIDLRHSDDRLKITQQQQQPQPQLPYRTQIRIEQQPKSSSGNVESNSIPENQAKSAQLTQNGQNLERLNVSSTQQTPQFCQCSSNAPQFQQFAGQHFCSCQPPQMYDSNIGWYTFGGNNFQRIGQQDAPTQTSTNIYVDVIPTLPETVPAIARNDTIRPPRSLSKGKNGIIS